MNYEEKELQEHQEDRHEEARTVDDSNSEKDWRKNVSVVLQYSRNCQKTLDPLAQF